MSHQDRTLMANFIGVLAALIVLAFVFYFIASTVAVTDPDEKKNDPMVTRVIEENIKPVSSVSVADESAPAQAAAPAAPRSGADVYQAACMACHGTGAAGAPKTGDNAAWASRAEKGLDGLLATAISGVNAMPPRGLCGDCSDAELEAAIAHMLSESGIDAGAASGGADEDEGAGEDEGNGSAGASASAAAGAWAGDAVAGQQTYMTFCQSCHATGAAGAPKVGDAAAWSARIAKGADGLLSTAKSGINAMPPKGLCMTCSDDELANAIAYMVQNSQ